ncbi:dna helicase recq family member [Holotrichia oblita]|uniref:Dna helicase recq family member n=1 Tax=Holotrichia oblita TaxID=644536 RepID=A0ACB9TYI3_HOLOL|nr:dna helicase recq family member [Holotrichia oblita]
MELIQNPEQKAMYDKCKYRVKLWEYHFKKQHGRVPSKLDIREAENEVRFAYKMYFNLKSAAIERSFVDIDGFQSDDEDCKSNDAERIVTSSCLIEESIDEKVWSTDLNNQASEVVKKDKPKSNVNASFSQKLFGGSKFSKRNPRKSLSTQNKKSQNNITEVQSLLPQQNENFNPQDSMVEKSLSQEFFDSFIEENTSNFKIVKQKSQVASQSLDVIQSMLRNNYKLKKTLDTGWIDRITNKNGTDEVLEQNVNDFDLSKKCVHSIERSKSLSYDYDSDDVIANSEDEACDNLSGVAVTKPEEKIMIAGVVPVEPINTPIPPTAINDMEKKENEVQIPNDKIEPINGETKTKITKSMKTQSTKQTQVTRKPVRNSRPTRSKKPSNLKENSDSDDQNYSETELEDSLSKIDKTTETKLNKSTKKVIKAKIKDAEPEKYELEYSVKPRIVTVPRITKIKKIVTKNEKKDEESASDYKPKTKQDIAKEKLEKKIATGSLNENFVSINIKKKVFVRGKKGMNFSKYKKQMWKNKKKALSGPDMDMGGCDGGVLTCFNCGDVGHFARQCPKRHGDKLLPLDVAGDGEEEESLFPTLEEAEKMAEESALAVRKSNKKLMKRGNNEENVDSDARVDGETCEDEFVEDSQDNDSDDDQLLAETLRLEELVAKLDTQAYIDSTNFVKPYYELTDNGNVIDTTKEVYDALKEFGYTQFRPGQEAAIMRILSGKSTLVTLSTGSGKSLCYQLPAYIYSKREPCIALVISPLVSLMEDQVTGLPPFLKAACLHTNQTKTQREKVMELVSAGSLSILLVSPEAVAAGERSTGFGSLLRKLPPISFACIDEAHCVSQWSHNFRPSYLMICRILRERLGVTTILGLTATATVSTANNIIEHLKVSDGSDGIISDIPLPHNLHLTVSKDSNRDNALVGLLLSERFAQCRSVIVYCTRREECERVARFLRSTLRDEKSEQAGGNTKKRKRMSEQAEPYHAGLSAKRRKSIQNSFMSGELRIVVATVAFGMGINKSDIRSVIHYNMPSSFESYVQEIGRAGRDGLPAHCHLFLDSQGNDESELRRHIHANSIDWHVIRKLLQRIFIPCSCKDTCPKHEVAFSIKDTVQALDVPEENIATLLCYLELHDNRYVQVLRPAYTSCKIISYKGVAEIRKASKECAPLAMALALYANKQGDNKENIFEFPVVDVASAMGWDSGICKHKLKNLEWTSVNGQPKRSNLSVEFSNLGFCVLAPGNLNDTQLDDTLDYLYKRVVDQEKMCLMQLRALHTTLSSVAAKTYKGCLERNRIRIK